MPHLQGRPNAPNALVVSASNLFGDVINGLPRIIQVLRQCTAALRC